METPKFDDTFLSRWLDNRLTESELRDFENSKEYTAYKDIINGIDRFDKLPLYDSIEKFAELQKRIVVSENIPKKDTKTHKLIPTWAISMAASIALLVGIAYFFSKRTITVTTDFAEKTSLILPDNSEVVLNASATLSYNKNTFEDERVLKLNGEGFFKVAKGSKFTVNTPRGSVTVLGTQFNVNSRENIFESICYEGKVRVQYNGKQHVVNAGNAVRIMGKDTVEFYTIKEKQPSWIQNQSSFRSTPLKEVIEELERQFGIVVNSDAVDTDKLFTGTFEHNNLENALKVVFTPMSISYRIESKKSIVLTKVK